MRTPWCLLPHLIPFLHPVFVVEKAKVTGDDNDNGNDNGNDDNDDDQRWMLTALTLQGDRDGHHHDRVAKCWQDFTPPSSGGECPLDAERPTCVDMLHPGECKLTDCHLGRRIHCRVSLRRFRVAQANGSVVPSVSRCYCFAQP